MCRVEDNGLPTGIVASKLRWSLVLVAAGYLVSLSAVPVAAGGGPENVLLVVNPKSTASMTIGNHYVLLREIPPQNVLYLDWDPSKDRTDIDSFRQEILVPVLKAAFRESRRRIDYVVYSSDFPWAIDAAADVNRLLAFEKARARKSQSAAGARSGDDAPAEIDNPAGADQGAPILEWPETLAPTASLNGLTYLWQLVLSRDPRLYLSLGANHYARRPDAQEGLSSSEFRSTHMLAPGGKLVSSEARARGQESLRDAVERRREGKPVEPVELPGVQYLLSTMLGVTTGRGNSVSEVVNYLQRSADADGTFPSGTIYFAENDDVRSRTRQPGFGAAIEELKGLHVEAEVVRGEVPRNKPDVQGAMIGSAIFDWDASGSTILPGAICEHLTSFGGVMSANGSQTPLSEFLRYGAAAASGAVTEPFSIQAKFPLPSMHVHYASGCTLAEAFYQSVFGPYQLLIVGDPLCRPWANIPAVAVEGLEDWETVTGKFELTPTAIFSKSSMVEEFELYIDGSLRDRGRPGEKLAATTEELADGYHELRVVALESGAIRSHGHRIIPIRTSNHARSISVSDLPRASIPSSGTVSLTCQAPGSIGIAVLQNTRLLTRAAGDTAHLQLKASELGRGPVRIFVVGLGSKGPASNVTSDPIDFVVE